MKDIAPFVLEQKYFQHKPSLEMNIQAFKVLTFYTYTDYAIKYPLH